MYIRIVTFIVVGLKQIIPFVVQAIPEVTFNSQWPTDKISDNIDNLLEIGVCVQGIDTSSHSTNVNAFLTLIKYSIQIIQFKLLFKVLAK